MHFKFLRPPLKKIHQAGMLHCDFRFENTLAADSGLIITSCAIKGGKFRTSIFQSRHASLDWYELKDSSLQRFLDMDDYELRDQKNSSSNSGAVIAYTSLGGPKSLKDKKKWPFGCKQNWLETQMNTTFGARFQTITRGRSAWAHLEDVCVPHPIEMCSNALV